MNRVRKLQENRLQPGGDFLEFSFAFHTGLVFPSSVFPATVLRELRACLTISFASLTPSTTLAFQFDLMIPTCLNDKIEKAFTK